MSKKTVAICGTAGFGNSKKLTELDDSVKEFIINRIADYPILIGDCPLGADYLVQNVLRDCNAQNVMVYFSVKPDTAKNTPRYLASDNFMPIPICSDKTGREFQTGKDIAMIDAADCLFAIWDGNSKGTRRNIEHALTQGKRTMIYFTPDFNVQNLRNHMHVFETLSEFTSVF